MRFVLREVTDTQLVGDLHRVSLENVSQLERWHFSVGRTALLFAACAYVYVSLSIGSWVPW